MITPTDIVLIALIAAACVLVIRRLLRDRRAGKSGCGGDCGSCAWGENCHKR